MQLPVRYPNYAEQCPFPSVPQRVLFMVLPTSVIQVNPGQPRVPISVWEKMNGLIQLKGATNVSPVSLGRKGKERGKMIRIARTNEDGRGAKTRGQAEGETREKEVKLVNAKVLE